MRFVQGQGNAVAASWSLTSTTALARRYAWVLLFCFVLGCHIAPYKPLGGRLLKEGPGSNPRYSMLRLFEAPGRFFVVETWQGSDPRNSICTFETLADAEDFYRRTAEKLPIPCGILPFEPEGGKLVSEKNERTVALRLFAVGDGFQLVETRQDRGCLCGNRGRPHEGGAFNVKSAERGHGNHVCMFNTAEEAERFQERLWLWHTFKITGDDRTHVAEDFERLCSRVPDLLPMAVGETAEQLSGEKITAENAHRNQPHYSITVPSDHGWYLVPCREDESLECVSLELRHGPPEEGTVRIRFMKIDILSDRLKSMSSKQVAEDYRNREEQGMIEEGVNKGLYRLSDVAMGVDDVGEKRFYTMSYATSASIKNQKAALYLYFPRDKDHRFFIMAHYSDMLPRGAPAGSLFDAFREDFLQVLKSLSVVQ
jgi:hypothetical protein